MISIRDPKEFIPYGRGHCARHPREVGLPPPVGDAPRVSGPSQAGSWRLYLSPDGSGDVEEELYTEDNVLVYSRGGDHVRAFTLDAPVSHALRCEYTSSAAAHVLSEEPPGEETTGSRIAALSCVSAAAVQTWTDDGEHFITPLPFQVRRLWSLQEGVLIERRLPAGSSEDRLPTLFSLLHPLDDISPLITRVGGGEPTVAAGGRASVVLVIRQPPLCVTFDRQTGSHAVWRLRRTEPEEWWAAGDREQTVAATPVSQCGSLRSLSLSLSRLSQPAAVSPSAPPRSETHTPVSRSRNSSRLNGGGPLLNLSVGPGLLSRSQSPSALAVSAGTASYLRLCVSPSPRPPPPDASATGAALDDTMLEAGEPLRPEICLQLLWRDALATSEPAAGGFLTTDLSGVQYLVLVAAARGQLRLTRLQTTADGQLQPRGTATLPGRNAVSLEASCTMLVLEQSGGLVLYSGTHRLCKVHVPGVPPPALALSFSLPPSLPGSPFCPPRRSSLVSGARGLESRFDDALSLTLSPVRPEPPGESSEQSSFRWEPAAQEDSTLPLSGSVAALRTAVGDSVIMEHTSGALYRLRLPAPADSGAVAACLRAARAVLPPQLANTLTGRWFTARHAPGARHLTPAKHWRAFAATLLRLMGYQVERLAIAPLLEVTGSSVTHQRGKRCRSEDGTDQDWEFLLASGYHAEVRAEEWTGVAPVLAQEGRADSTAPLLPHIAALLFVLHLVYEDCKVDSLSAELLPAMAAVLHQVASDLGWRHYVDYYWRDFPDQCSPHGAVHSQLTDQERALVQPVAFARAQPPDLLRCLEGDPSAGPYPRLDGVNQLSTDLVTVFALLRGRQQVSALTEDVCPTSPSEAGGRLQRCLSELPPPPPAAASAEERRCSHQQRAVRLLDRLGYRWPGLQLLPAAVRLPLLRAVLQVRASPPVSCPDSLCRLVGREELTGAAPAEDPPPAPPPAAEPQADDTAADPPEQGGAAVDAELVRLRWPADHRLEETRQLLASSRPVSVVAPPRPELTDHERLDEQKRLLYALCQRTMAVPVGRGMVWLHTAAPVVTQPLTVPPLCLTGRAPPRGATVDLADMDLPVNMNVWPHFHNGVAAGLRVAPNAAQIDAAWILYNRPKTNAENPVEHAGFLMALGLNGHLSHLARLNVHDYLIKGHEMTSVGLLLGLAAGKRGTMDVGTTKLLSIHVESMLPPTSRELDIAHSVQVAAALGVGLVYQGSNNRHVAEVLLREMGRPAGPEMENSADREAYSLAAGLGLGLVTLRAGGDQRGLTAQLRRLVFGGARPPLTGPQKEKYKTPSYHIREGDTVNTDVTAAGATLALGLMYMGSGNRAVAEWLRAPETLYLLDQVRPDLLQLRTLARALVLWEEVRPTRRWLDQQLPELARPGQPRRSAPDCQTARQVYCQVTSGACLALGLRYAGTADPEAYRLLLQCTRTFIAHAGSSLAEEAGRPTVENSLCVIVTALAMVMAGTGDLEVLRVCRLLRARTGAHHVAVTYGSHMAVHMALGLLFLGGGRHSLRNSPDAVAALICAFFPRYPFTSCDGRYHLQALRHLYVLASEPRLIVPRDLTSGQLTYCRLMVTLRDAASPDGRQMSVEAPCLLPQLDTIQEIRVDDRRFWPFTVTSESSVHLLGQRLCSGGRLQVKRRTAAGRRQLALRSRLTQALAGRRQPDWAAERAALVSSVSPAEQRSLCRYFLPPPAAGDPLPLQLTALLQLCAGEQQAELFLPAASLLLRPRSGRPPPPLRLRLLRCCGADGPLAIVADAAELAQQRREPTTTDVAASLGQYLTGRAAASAAPLAAALASHGAPGSGSLPTLSAAALEDPELVFRSLPADSMAAAERCALACLLTAPAPAQRRPPPAQ